MSATAHTFDNRQQLLVGPGEIRPGDWLRDLGTLRQVESIDTLGVSGGGPGTLYILHFVEQPGVHNRALGLSSSSPSHLTIWREPRTEQ
jgi:hypothetical protein